MKFRDSILATLAYYDGFEYPLTLFEVYRYLINPQRLRPHIESLKEITLRDIQDRLETLVEQGSVAQEKGFYFLKDKTELGTRRLEREKISAQKWRLCLSRAFWLQAVPWIRGMFVSGSLAMGTVDQDSDFDILVIVESGRLYLVRLILSGLTSLMGARRTRFESLAPDKFCFNHYLTTGLSLDNDSDIADRRGQLNVTTPTPSGRGDALEIKHQSIYNAQTYAHLVPLLASHTIVGEFFAANLWINKYVYNFTPHQQTVRRTVRPSPALQSIARIIEKIFSGSFGDFFERRARSYQQKRIAANPTTRAPGGRVIYTNTELEFHPHSFERVILDRYNATTRRLGVAINPEPDSGLRS